MSKDRLRTSDVFKPLYQPMRYKGAWGGRGSAAIRQAKGATTGTTKIRMQRRPGGSSAAARQALDLIRLILSKSQRLERVTG
jgi:hypothetical protein